VTELPKLHDTIVVAAFEGWNDAGDAASDALEHLDAIWEAETLVEIDDEAYYDYQVNRPVIRQIDGVRLRSVACSWVPIAPSPTTTRHDSVSMSSVW